MDTQNQTNLNENPGSDELDDLLKTLTLDQIRFVVARLQCGSDSEAAAQIGYNKSTVSQWGEPVKRAVRLLALDGVHVAREIFRRALPKAAAIKAAGLESDDEKIRQQVATEIIERGLGKPAQRQEISGPDGGAIRVEQFGEALRRVYGGDSGDAG